MHINTNLASLDTHFASQGVHATDTMSQQSQERLNYTFNVKTELATDGAAIDTHTHTLFYRGHRLVLLSPPEKSIATASGNI